MAVVKLRKDTTFPEVVLYFAEWIRRFKNGVFAFQYVIMTVHRHILSKNLEFVQLPLNFAVSLALSFLTFSTRIMKKQFRSTLLPVLLFASLSAFVYVNVSSKCLSVKLPADQVLVDKTHIGSGNDNDEAGDAPSLASGVMVYILSLAKRFLPVSN